MPRPLCSRHHLPLDGTATYAAKACITSAKRGDLVEALGQLEAAREARTRLCEAWTAVLDGLAAGGSAATLRFFEAMLHDGFGLGGPARGDRFKA